MRTHDALRSPPHEPRTTIVTRRYHDRVARQYDSIYDDPYWDFHDELTWRVVKPHLPRAAAARADLGCGTGKWGSEAAQERLRHHLRRSLRRHGRAGPRSSNPWGPRAKRRNARRRRHRRDARTCRRIHSRNVSRWAIRCRSAPTRTPPPTRCRASPGPADSSSPPPTTSSPPLTIYVDAGNLDALEEFIKAGRTNWLTADERERFELTDLHAGGLRNCSSSGFEVLTWSGRRSSRSHETSSC